MEQFLPQLVAVLLGGSGQAVIAVLLIAITGLVTDRRRLLNDIKAKEARIDQMIDNYYRATSSMSEALAGVRQYLELRLNSR
jgi:20S proteasome alpha/beta subunit